MPAACRCRLTVELLSLAHERNVEAALALAIQATLDAGGRTESDTSPKGRLSPASNFPPGRWLHIYTTGHAPSGLIPTFDAPV